MNKKRKKTSQRHEIIKRFAYYQNPNEVEEMYNFLINSTSSHHKHRLENYNHKWDHRFFWGYVAEIDSLPSKMNIEKGHYFYCLYKQDYNFFTYAMYVFMEDVTFPIGPIRLTGELFNTITDIEDEIIKNPNVYKHPIDRGFAPPYRQETVRRAREAIIMWLLCAKRLKIGKDLTQLIGKMCWDKRCLWME